MSWLSWFGKKNKCFIAGCKYEATTQLSFDYDHFVDCCAHHVSTLKHLFDKNRKGKCAFIGCNNEYRYIYTFINKSTYESTVCCENHNEFLTNLIANKNELILLLQQQLTAARDDKINQIAPENF